VIFVGGYLEPDEDPMSTKSITLARRDISNPLMAPSSKSIPIAENKHQSFNYRIKDPSLYPPPQIQ
jgi:hypothetical protein